jgi:NRPS condensation-like uncharacterized protein
LGAAVEDRSLLMRVPFNILDEAFAHIDDPTQPLTVQIEARVPDRLDDDRIRAALGVAASRHPLARARVLPWQGGDPHPEWQVDDVPQLDPLRVVEVAGDDELDELRGDLLSIPLSLFESPPWRARLVHAPGGDVLMLSVHHAASDGMGCLRLLRSALRAYSGAADPAPDLDPVESHSLGFSGAPTGPPRWQALSLELRKLRHVTSPPARVAADGATEVPGYGIVTRRIPTDVVVGSPLRRRLGASVNDLLLAALHLTIDRWNAQHDQPAGRISVHMPINARPAPYKDEVVGNLVTGEMVSTTPEQRASAHACLAAVAGWTASVKDRGAQPATAFLAALPNFTVGLKRAVIVGAVNLGDRAADSSVLSNVGSVGADWVAADGVDVEEVLFSPPASMPLGVGVGAAATEQWLTLSFRHRWALLDRPAAVGFSDLFVATLHDIAGGE